jgi:hypothetical protein
MRVTMPSQLTGDHKEKFDLLRDHFGGVFQLLAALDGVGYRPDNWTSVALDEAIDALYRNVGG